MQVCGWRSSKNPQKNQHNVQRAYAGTCTKTISDNNICMLHTYYIRYVIDNVYDYVMIYNNYLIHRRLCIYVDYRINALDSNSRTMCLLMFYMSPWLNLKGLFAARQQAYHREYASCIRSGTEYVNLYETDYIRT